MSWTSLLPSLYLSASLFLKHKQTTTRHTHIQMQFQVAGRINHTGYQKAEWTETVTHKSLQPRVGLHIAMHGWQVAEHSYAHFTTRYRVTVSAVPGVVVGVATDSGSSPAQSPSSNHLVYPWTDYETMGPWAWTCDVWPFARKTLLKCNDIFQQHNN